MSGALVIADCQLGTAELVRLDEPAECCAILPVASGGPWGQHWRVHCQGSPEPRMPSGSKGDEYSFAVRPLTRDVAARYPWTWSIGQQSMAVPPRSIHASLGFPTPYIISPRWWTDVLSTLPWQAMANFDLGDLAAGLYRIFLLPRAEADGGTRAIVVADLGLVRREQHSPGCDAKRRQRLANLVKHASRLPPLGEWRSSAAVLGAASSCGLAPATPEAPIGHSERGVARRSAGLFGWRSEIRYFALEFDAVGASVLLHSWRSEDDAAARPGAPRGSDRLCGPHVSDLGGSKLRLATASGTTIVLQFASAHEHSLWLTGLRGVWGQLGSRLEGPTTSRVEGPTSSRVEGPTSSDPLGESFTALEHDVADGDGDVPRGLATARGDSRLYPHQARTVAWMETVESTMGGLLSFVRDGLTIGRQRAPLPYGGLLAHPPGAGKTRCVVELVRRGASARRATGATAIFAPAHLVRQWEAELALGGVSDGGARSATAHPFGPALNGDESPARVLRAIKAHQSIGRVIIDEPQDAPMEWRAAFHAAMGVHCPHAAVWALCGTASEHVSEITQLLLCQQPAPLDEEALSLAAIALVHARTVRDPPSSCLPTPPLRSQDVPVALTAAEASDSQVARLSGHLADALLLIAFGRSAAFAAAPEREGLLRRLRTGRGRDATSASGRTGDDAAGTETFGCGAPLLLDCWSGALEAGITRRQASASAALAAAEAKAAEQKAAAEQSTDQRAERVGGAGGGAFASMLSKMKTGLASGAPAAEWVGEAISVEEETRGVDPQLISELASLRRTLTECDRALQFSAAMRALVANAESECPVCLEAYEIAAVLPCLHSTCRDCIRRHAASTQSFSCPLCRTIVQRAEVVTFAKPGVPGMPPAATPPVAVEAVAAPLVTTREEPTETLTSVSVSATTPGGVMETEALLRNSPSEHALPGASLRVRALVALLRTLLSSGSDERILVYTQWAAHVAHLAAVLSAANVAHLTLGEALPQTMAALQAFGQPQQPRVLLMSQQRHASGINLQCARHVVIVHPYCTPTARSVRQVSLGDLTSYERQAVGRVRRFPQRLQVEVYRFLAPGTVEEEMYAGRLHEA